MSYNTLPMGAVPKTPGAVIDRTYSWATATVGALCERPLFCLCALVVCCVLATPSAFAQVNLSGVWENLGILHEDWPDRLFGPELGDYGGVPLTDAARLRADSWDASLITLPEYQCRVHPSDYAPSFAGIRIWEERDRDS